MSEGDCYEANGKFILDLFLQKANDLNDWKIIHGKVIGAKGTNVEGETINHCWIELKDEILVDYSNNNKMVCYIEKIKHRLVSRDVIMTPFEYSKKVAIFGHYGDFEE